MLVLKLPCVPNILNINIERGEIPHPPLYFSIKLQLLGLKIMLVVDYPRPDQNFSSLKSEALITKTVLTLGIYNLDRIKNYCIC